MNWQDRIFSLRVSSATFYLTKQTTFTRIFPFQNLLSNITKISYKFLNDHSYRAATVERKHIYQKNPYSCRYGMQQMNVRVS